MLNICDNKELEKQVMIRDIITFSDLYNDKEGLLKMDYKSIKSLYYSCLIPLLKGGFTKK